MATLVYAYSARSGQPILGGHFPNAATALVGDSLTDGSYELTTATWMGGMAGGALQPVLNIGVSGETIANVLARIDNAYTAGSPGLAGIASALGLTKLRFIVLRIGTNDARGLATYSGIASNFAALVAKLGGYAYHVLVCGVPPITAPEADATNKNASTIDLNAGYAAFAAANPSYCHYINDADALRVGGLASGAGIAAYFGDGVHYGNAGLRILGIAGGTAFAALGITSRAPLVTSNADTYQVTPASAQWADNPANTGSAANSGTFTGNVVTGVAVGSQGTGSGTVSIVAAGGGDSNQTPWQRVTPTGGQGGGWTVAVMTTHGRSITSIDPSRCEALIEVRFNALNVTNVKRLTFSARGATTANQYLIPQFWLGLGPEATTVTQTVVMRSKLPRASGATESGLDLFLQLEYTADFSGASMGSFDFRCLSLRG